MQENWNREAARLGGPLFAEVLIEVRDTQRQLVLDIAELKERDASAEGAIARLLAGFPANDIEGHRRYHESVIEWRELRNKMVREGLIKVAQAGALAGTGILIGVLWKAFKMSVIQ